MAQLCLVKYHVRREEKTPDLLGYGCVLCRDGIVRSVLRPSRANQSHRSQLQGFMVHTGSWLSGLILLFRHGYLSSGLGISKIT